MTATLDLDEMFHLAILASQKGDHEKAILYLKEGAEKEGSARFYYLLGAEYAELSMYPRAIENIEKALEIDPSLSEAAFQLGLLWAMINEVDKAKKAWAQLDTLGEANYLHMFKTAIIHAFDGDFSSALALAEKGKSANQTNVALNNDMDNLIKHWQTQVSSEVAQISASEEQDSQEGENYFLSAYQDKP